MIRVGFLLPHFRAGGAERVVLHWIGALDRTRYQPLLFLKKVEGEFLDHLPADVTPIALGAGRALRLPRHIAKALRVHDIDVAYSATNAMNLALLAARAGQTARIVSEHTPPDAYLSEAKLRPLRRAAMRYLYPRADAVAVPTDRIGMALSVSMTRPITTITLPNPVIDTVTTISTLRQSHSVPQLVSAGRLVAAKAYDVLIQACHRLVGQGMSFHLTIHGDGPLRQELQSLIAALGLADRITLAGHSDRLAEAIAAADLFVLASRREGFGNVVIEAMAVGTPVLATTGGGPETIIRHGDNGFLVPPEDADMLAAALAGLIADPARRDAVRHAAADTAHGFGIAASTRRFEALVDRLANTRSMTA
ncbi:glycosyltransferase [Sphingomonas endolithica]|uniref:glycosyltransferase n=1 Tax=Sphingomonas endolithica TaxID=2972485 RepID=UPI0021AF676A|nr:glycosyltransferase [Sphingomonas sp. ZFBP2030]